jgi:hypothetical protein
VDYVRGCWAKGEGTALAVSFCDVVCGGGEGEEDWEEYGDHFWGLIKKSERDGQEESGGKMSK